MNLIEDLLSAAHEDTQLLIKNDSLGDDFSIPRDVDFVLYSTDGQRAQTVASFIADNQYGVPRVEVLDGRHRILVTINMPITRQVLCSISALMVCLAQLFSIEYDGWGCVIQKGG